MVPFPRLDGRWQVSVDGGRFPRWSPDGSRLYFWSSGKLMAVPLETSGDTLQIGLVEEILDQAWGGNLNSYAIHPDGDRFLILAPDSAVGPASISLFLNWHEELEQR